MASALGKSLDLPGFTEVLVTYQAFPPWSLWPLTLLITVVEWILGLLILSGRRLREAASFAMCLNGAYALWMTATLLRGLELANCGCFGRFFPQPLRWHSPLEDLVLAGMCYATRRLTAAEDRPVDMPV